MGMHYTYIEFHKKNRAVNFVQSICVISIRFHMDYHSKYKVEMHLKFHAEFYIYE